MNLRDFNFSLPQSLIAQEPTAKRDESRLLVLLPDGKIEHKRFSDIINYLNEGDMLILNNTRVQQARLEAFKSGGGRLDILLVRNVSDGCWEILPSKKYTGKITIGKGRSAEIKDGRYLIYEGSNEELLSLGQMPLPPYIKRRPDDMDKERYQTVYAKVMGSIAAPTAGLHFTVSLLDAIKQKGVLIRYLTLHVGKGTFIPVRAHSVHEHSMEPECFEIPQGIIHEIEKAKENGRRVVSVGTTTTRALEGLQSKRFTASLSTDNGSIMGATDIFIYPGYRFKAVDSLITNFHLPCSTPLLLTSAIAGRERLLSAYRVAVEAGYRFFSYGDAMLIA